MMNVKRLLEKTHTSAKECLSSATDAKITFK